MPNNRLLWILVAVPAFGYGTGVMAACTQADGGGTWRVYSNSVDGGGYTWVRCSLVVASTGKINGTSSLCRDPGGSSARITSGSLKVANSCQVTASFVLNGRTFTIVESWLTRDKLALAGVGRFPGGLFQFTAIRQ